MTNNDILRRIRYTFDFNDKEMVDIFALANTNVTEEQIISWLKKEEDENYIKLNNTDFSMYLNGLINLKRGTREGEQPKPEYFLNNNMIFQKLRIALNLKAEDIIDILELVDFKISKHELSAFFRKPDNKHFRECKDQILRNFLMGIQRQLRPNSTQGFQE